MISTAEYKTFFQFVCDNKNAVGYMLHHFKDAGRIIMDHNFDINNHDQLMSHLSSINKLLTSSVDMFQFFDSHNIFVSIYFTGTKPISEDQPDLHVTTFSARIISHDRLNICNDFTSRAEAEKQAFQMATQILDAWIDQSL